MASRNPEINRLISQAINEVPPRVLSPEQKVDQEIATREYLARLYEGQLQTRCELWGQRYKG